MHLVELRGTLKLFSKISFISAFLLRKLCSPNPSKKLQGKDNIYTEVILVQTHFLKLIKRTPETRANTA